MSLFNLESFITLFLIKKIKGFRDAYSLTRVLAWKFDIIAVAHILKCLEEEKLIKTLSRSGNEEYEITDKGSSYVSESLIEAKILILERYSKDRDFIDSLFTKEI